MSTGLRELVRFHLTGESNGDTRREQPGLRSALLAPYRDLSELRYDYPLVLIERDADGVFVRSLSSVVNSVLEEIAPAGAEGERVRPAGELGGLGHDASPPPGPGRGATGSLRPAPRR